MGDAYCVNTAAFCPYCSEDVRADFAVFSGRGAQIGKFCQSHAHDEVKRLNQETDNKEKLKSGFPSKTPFHSRRGH